MVNLQKQLYTARTHEAFAKFEQYERKIDEMEAEAESYETSGKTKSLADEFAELQVQDEIEKELEKIEDWRQNVTEEKK